MSILIDDLIQITQQNKSYNGFEHGYFIAKPYDLQICSVYTLFKVVVNRINDAIRIITGASQAYHYMEDTYK